ncbi:hypothetical protein CMQ_6882 [Grosmannia clavigera kw1407]|uniref:Mitochondrial export translocase n=1 Tax=Grosmannia clavigera (strain kw1407 / UAMH 11150) TaxID=655863 RepID=F0X7F6_GROCL|nr:uncharacterized protein CMQ_6882 [Grosmannia clavigera kw1407]EFX06561.1 hypothetical protein CMQ_6882 [Grosmannia clavigera kw1407]
MSTTMPLLPQGVQGGRGLRAIQRATSKWLLHSTAVATRPAMVPRQQQHPHLISITSALTRHGLVGHHGKRTPSSREFGRMQTTHRSPPVRSFHLSSAAVLVSAPVNATEALIGQLHMVTQAPWFVVLPLVALGVNLVFRLPFSAHARGLAQRRAGLAPLLQAWAAEHAKTVHQERRQAGGSSDAATTATPDGEAMKRYRRTARQVYRRFGLQQWKLYGSLAAMPPWLVVIEAIRRMCGAPVGLLGLILRRGADGEVAAATETAESTVAGAAAAAQTDAVLSALPSTLEPSLTTGGCLWFPDLTVADPYHVLPLALSAMLIANVLPATDAGRRALFGLGPQSSSSPVGGTAQVTTEGAFGRGLQRTLLIMSASIGFVTMHFPAAIHLYWLSSAATSFVITRSLRKARPLPERNIKPANKIDFPWIRPPRPAQREKSDSV